MAVAASGLPRPPVRLAIRRYAMYLRLFSLFFPLLAAAQSIPISRGNPINLIPPATSADGNIVVFAAAMAPDGTPQKGTNLYLFSQGPTPAAIRRLTNYIDNSTYNSNADWVGVNSISYSAGFAAHAGRFFLRKRSNASSGVLQSPAFTSARATCGRPGDLQLASAKTDSASSGMFNPLRWATISRMRFWRTLWNLAISVSNF